MPLKTRHGYERRDEDVSVTSVPFDASSYEKGWVYVVSDGHTVTIEGSVNDGATWFIIVAGAVLVTGNHAILVDPIPALVRVRTSGGIGTLQLSGLEGLRSIGE